MDGCKLFEKNRTENLSETYPSYSKQKIVFKDFRYWWEQLLYVLTTTNTCVGKV